MKKVKKKVKRMYTMIKMWQPNSLRLKGKEVGYKDELLIKTIESFDLVPGCSNYTLNLNKKDPNIN